MRERRDAEAHQPAADGAEPREVLRGQARMNREQPRGTADPKGHGRRHHYQAALAVMAVGVEMQERAGDEAFKQRREEADAPGNGPVLRTRRGAGAQVEDVDGHPMGTQTLGQLFDMHRFPAQGWGIVASQHHGLPAHAHRRPHPCRLTPCGPGRRGPHTDPP